MTENEKETLRELEQKLFDLSCELGGLASRAHWLEDKADHLRATLHDLRYKLKISEEWTE